MASVTEMRGVYMFLFVAKELLLDFNELIANWMQKNLSDLITYTQGGLVAALKALKAKECTNVFVHALIPNK